MHHDVVFSSMYPSVLMSSKISIENYTISKSSFNDGAACSNSNSTTFVINGNNVAFDKRNLCVIPSVMKFLVDERRRVRKKNIFYSTSFNFVAPDKNSSAEFYAKTCILSKSLTILLFNACVLKLSSRIQK